MPGLDITAVDCFLQFTRNGKLKECTMSNLATEWNERHCRGGAWAKTGPSQELQRVLKEGWIPPGRVLELGCGMGIDAVYLAPQGFDVTAVDASPLAVEQARARARTAGVSIR